MEPRIQYAKTSDGVNIAFWTLGEGIPFVHMPMTAFSHGELEWQFAEMRRWYERLAHKRKLVRYDGRGSGLSDRNVTNYSLEAHMLDLEAVVDGLGLERFALFASLHLGPVAIAYTARHPERVSHLLPWCTWARASDYYRSPQVQTLGSLRDKDWEIYTETVAHAFLEWSEGERARRFAAFIRESGTQEALQGFVQAAEQFDVTSLLPQVKSPTLVLHRRQLRLVGVELAKGLATRISGARLALLEGGEAAPFAGDMEAVAEAIDEFLGEGEEAAAGTSVPAPSGLVTILFTDIEGSTAMTQRLGDAKAREVLREHERIVREALRAHGGSEVKTMGDGFMASFGSAARALECAVAIQQAFTERNESALEPILVRVGLNAGEPIAEDDDLYGTAVNEAARITAAAQGGEILVADVVRQLTKGKDFLFADRGETSLRGFEDPVRLFEVRWHD
ncbi:MAG: adenylate/guanylate cyclase domain-containing protein [Dehalococcoidia bacterium]|nr:adenylate/guanylate cyclase domain-containing protein [Dehalococcoidia bacterium]